MACPQAWSRAGHRAGRPVGVPGSWPANALFWDAVGEADPSLVRAFNPWDEITTPAALAALFPPAAVPAVAAAPGRHHLGRPEDFWDIVLGSGYRATIDALSPAQCGRLHERLLGELRSR